jgi:kinesin family protein 18/19
LVKQQDDKIFLGDGALSFNTSDKENPYTTKKYAPKGIRKIVDVVDDRMLIFDPPQNSPLASISKNIFPHGKRTTRFKEHRFVFDKLFDEDTSQDNVYHDTTRPLLDSVLDGFNATVFAYGATGCGKTHTISGTMDQPGIIFLTMKELFEKIEDLKDTKVVDVSLSYLEIYNETIRDLMEPENNGKLLTLREDANKRISVSNLSMHKPGSVEDVMDMIIIGNRNRTCSPTEANATSSRSHAVLQINVTQRNRTADIKEDHTFATLSIIDLAGSERAAATRNRGERLQEGANINKSLLALGNCINALCDVRRRNHVPYRDSKLTRLLKFSLGGNCKTVMIVCISPSSHHYDETLNTLKYADRAKEIKTKIIRNQHSLNRHVGSYLKMITEQKQEIEELRKRETVKIEEALERYKAKKNRVSIGILEFLDTLKQNLNSKKFQNLKIKKSLILCKRRLLLEQRTELNRYIKELHALEYRTKELDTMLSSIIDLMAKIDLKVSELESLYERETELDHVLASSADGAMRKLAELEGWTEYDQLTLEAALSLVKDSVERTVLYNASIAQDKITHSEDFMFNFRFTCSSLLRTMVQLNNCRENVNDVDTVKGELVLTTRHFYQGLHDSLAEVLNIDHKFEKFAVQLQYDVTADIVIPTSPIRRLAKTRASSPFTLSPSSRHSLGKSANTNRITKAASPVPNKLKAVKKVRWDVPDMSDDNMVYGDSDVSMEDLAKSTNDLDMLSKGSIIDDSINRSFSELEQVFAQKQKRKSLTSKSLKPNPRRSLTGARQSNEVHGLGAPVRMSDDVLNDF